MRDHLAGAAVEDSTGIARSTVITREDKRVLPGLLFAGLLVSASVVWMASEATAHNWYTGSAPKAGWSCCGEHDCERIVDMDRIVETENEFILDGTWHFDKDETSLPSLDGDYHACIWGGRPRCFFYPMNV